MLKHIPDPPTTAIGIYSTAPSAFIHRRLPFPHYAVPRAIVYLQALSLKLQDPSIGSRGSHSPRFTDRVVPREPVPDPLASR